ncbi:5526_t:CDS:1, partial [Entrophospora sp. SA101]
MKQKIVVLANGHDLCKGISSLLNPEIGGLQVNEIQSQNKNKSSISVNLSNVNSCHNNNNLLTILLK